MNKKISVTVGIAAHNEQSNIERILHAILGQKGSYRLESILVYCDGCTDQTAERARSILSDRIQVVDDGKRVGKVARVNQIIEHAKGDIVLILDADLEIAQDSLIQKIVDAFSDSRVMLVGGDTRPYEPKTFFERGVYATFSVFEASRKTCKNGHNIFGCNGGCIAVRSSFGKTITIPNVINEDDYLYFSCISRGYLFRHVPDATVYYKLPGNLGDYLKQSFRSDPAAVTQNFTKYFGDLVKTEYSRPFTTYFIHVARAFLHAPFAALYIMLIKALCIPFYPLISKRYKLEWYTAKSTK